MAKGNLFIVSAPSGAGKTTLLKALLETDDQLRLSISHTTRAKRPGEEDGADYHFVDEPRFMQIVGEGGFLEHAQVFGNYYGTSEAGIQEQRDQGFDVILEIDWQGARQVREHIAGTISIFILPPTRQALRQRLHARDQDNPEVIQRRLDEAKQEMSHFAEYDYLIVNDLFEQAVSELRAVVTAQRLGQARQAEKLSERLVELLS